MKTIKFFILILLSFNVYPKNIENDTLLKKKVIWSEFAGRCNIMMLQLDFINETKNVDVENFFLKFWKLQAKNENNSLDEFMTNCDIVIKGYEKLLN